MILICNSCFLGLPGSRQNGEAPGHAVPARQGPGWACGDAPHTRRLPGGGTLLLATRVKQRTATSLSRPSSACCPTPGGVPGPGL